MLARSHMHRFARHAVHAQQQSSTTQVRVRGGARSGGILRLHGDNGLAALRRVRISHLPVPDPFRAPPASQPVVPKRLVQRCLRGQLQSVRNVGARWPQVPDGTVAAVDHARSLCGASLLSADLLTSDGGAHADARRGQHDVPNVRQPQTLVSRSSSACRRREQWPSRSLWRAHGIRAGLPGVPKGSDGLLPRGRLQGLAPARGPLLSRPRAPVECAAAHRRRVVERGPPPWREGARSGAEGQLGASARSRRAGRLLLERERRSAASAVVARDRCAALAAWPVDGRRSGELHRHPWCR